MGISHGARYGPRGQLILALHTFCLEPYAIWEPNDGNAECLWANMEWAGRDIGIVDRQVTRGRMVNIGSSSSSSGQTDIANFRAFLVERREGTGEELKKMNVLTAYGTAALTEQ